MSAYRTYIWQSLKLSTEQSSHYRHVLLFAKLQVWELKMCAPQKVILNNKYTECIFCIYVLWFSQQVLLKWWFSKFLHHAVHIVCPSKILEETH